MNANAMAEAVLDDLVKRVLQVAAPERVLLFGSAARGTFDGNSDLDILVVVPDGVHRGRTCEAIHRNLFGFPEPADVIVVTESDVEKYADSPYLVIKPALDEGVELYRRDG